MIPFLVAGVLGAGVGGLLNYAGKEVNEDYKAKLRKENDEIEQLQKEAQQIIDNSRKGLKASMNKLEEQKKRIYSTTFDSFVKLTTNIKNVEFNDSLQGYDSSVNLNILNDMANDIKGIGQSYYYDDHIFGDSTFEVVFLPSFMTGSGVFTGLKIMEKIDEAKANKAKLKTEMEKIRIHCAKLDAVSRKCETFYSTIDALDKITNAYIEGCGEIVKKRGENYKGFTKAEKEAFMNLYNFIYAENDLYTVQMFTEGGNVSSKFSKSIATANERIESANNEEG